MIEVARGPYHMAVLQFERRPEPPGMLLTSVARTDHLDLEHDRLVLEALGSRSLRAVARYGGRKREPASGIIVLAAGRARLGQWPRQLHPEARQETPTSAIFTIGFQLRQRPGAAERPRRRSGRELPSPMTGRMSFPSPRPSCALSRAISETCWIRYLGHALDVERSKP